MSIASRFKSGSDITADISAAFLLNTGGANSGFPRSAASTKLAAFKGSIASEFCVKILRALKEYPL